MNPGTRRTSRWNKTAERAPEIDPESQKWTSADEAIVLIQNAFDVALETGRGKLIKACASSEVRSYYIAALLAEPRIRLAPIAPHLWLGRHGRVIDLKSGKFRSSDCYEGSIFISGVDLREWLAHPRRGPVPGQIDRYAEADRALFPELERIRRENNLTATEAARQVADRIEGSNTTEESRVRRLAKRFRSEN